MPEQLLKNRHYTFVLARDGQTRLCAPPGLAQQWQTAETSLLAIADACQRFNPQGISLYIADRPFQKYEGVTREDLQVIFKQGYDAIQDFDLCETLSDMMESYFQRKAKGEIQGEIILIVIDTEPKQRQSLIQLLVNATHRIDDEEELGIMFAQVGEDLIAQGFLQALDDDLHQAGAHCDIVDTKRLAQLKLEDIHQFLLSAIVD